MVNVPLLRKTMEHIENHPWEWRQTSWNYPISEYASEVRNALSTKGSRWDSLRRRFFGGMTKKQLREALEQQDAFTCDAAFCFAGWAAYLAGAEPATPAFGFGRSGGLTNPATGEYLGVSEYAQKALEIDERQAALLFTGDNDLPTLRSLVNRIIEDAERGQP